MSTQRFKVISEFSFSHPNSGRIMFETGSVFGITEKDNGEVIVDANGKSYVFDRDMAPYVLTFVRRMLRVCLTIREPEELEEQDEVSVYDLFDSFKATLANSGVDYENIGLVEEDGVTYFCVQVGDEAFTIEAGDDVLSLLREVAQYYTQQSQYEKAMDLIDYIVSVSK